MKETIYVILREFLSRIREKNFIITTLCLPIFIFILALIPLFMGHLAESNEDVIAISKDLNYMKEGLSTEKYKIVYADTISKNRLNLKLASGKIKYVLFDKFAENKKQQIVILYSHNRPEKSILNAIRIFVRYKNLSNIIKTGQDKERYKKMLVSNTLIISQKIQSKNIKNEQGPLHFSICLLFGIIIFALIEMHSSQIMRSVQEEKSNKLVEILITSISPLKIIIGKILGIALLGLTQISVWIVLSSIISVLFRCIINSTSINLNTYSFSGTSFNDIITYFNSLNIGHIMILFIVLFSLGYLLYATLFAVIGTITNSELLQQLSFLVTAPLMIALVSLVYVINNPDGLYSEILSIIPFTSPLVTLCRFMSGVSSIECLFSILVLIVTTISLMIFAGKVYRNKMLYIGENISIKNFFNFKN
ncbi:MAG: ABC transporter permease [Prevotella sp.]|jgi:ABC-2 type transport system permease protein|nr:ABC transporter permease [Prevotella sp.]MCH4212595.1 ABC transporter permease [Prevotella sp.]MCH4241089.1 ABC transporter permease [Prevotella sp.]